MQEAWNLLMEYQVQEMQKALAPYKDSLGEAEKNARSQLSTDSRNTVDGFQRFTDVTSALESLDVAVSMARRKPADSQVSALSSLRFLMEAHLQGIYILKERLVRWIRFEKKLVAKKSGEWTLLHNMEKTVVASFAGPNAVRASHVHETRHDTDDLSWAAGLELIARTRYGQPTVESMAWKLAAELKYRECRRAFLLEKKEEQLVLEKLLEILASAILPVLRTRSLCCGANTNFLGK